MIANEENNVSSNASTHSTRAPVAAPPKSRIRVWLTDDNVGFRSSLAQLLGRAGEFECERQFHSAEALLKGLSAGPPPDVILLDVEMGGMTGVEALRPIRALAPDVRVLIVTSFFDPMYETRASRDGASAYLMKVDAVHAVTGEIHQALASPVRLAPIESAPVSRQAQASASILPAGSDLDAAPGRAFMTRLRLWVVQVVTAMFGGHWWLHRTPARRNA